MKYLSFRCKSCQQLFEQQLSVMTADEQNYCEKCKNLEKQKVFIISDTHFSHKNIIKYERHHFKNTEEMDQQMIDNWNKEVGKHDLVFHLGDVVVCGAQRAEYVLNQLNGRKILILGNHDHFSKTKWLKLGFEPHERYFYKGYLLTHIPVDEEPLRVAVSGGFLKGNIHGHTHSLNDHLDKTLYKCCCVELTNYTPILFDDFAGV